jgi:hypothetical protein
MNNHALITVAMLATTAVPKGGRFVVSTPGVDGAVSLASDPTKYLRGVSVYDVATAAGDTVDVVELGIAPIAYGGNVAGDDSLTTDANGLAVKAVPAAGQTLFCLGFAEFSGVQGDRGAIRISPHFLKG